MKFTTNPTIGLVLALLLILAGWFMVSQGQGSARLFGGFFMAVGALAAVVNAVLLARRKRD